MSWLAPHCGRRQTPKLLAAQLLGWSVKAAAILPTVPSAATAAAQESARGIGGAGLLQALFGLAFVIGLIFLCGWAAKRFGLRPKDSGAMLKVIASANLGQREKVVVLEVGASWLVLGVTPQQISLLHSLDAEPVELAQRQASSPVAPAKGPVKLSQAFAQKLAETLNRQAAPGNRR